jgi:sugar phosphate isomerase/epimerase
MKLSFSTLACPGWGWGRIVDEALRLGYDAIEIRGIENELYLPRCRPFLPEQLEGTRAQLSESGLAICVLDTSCAFHDAGRYEGAIEEGIATIDLAQQLNVPYIRVFGDLIPDGLSSEDVIDRVASGLQSLGSYAEGKEVSVLLETHGDFVQMDYVQAALDRTTSPTVGVVWDVLEVYKHCREPLRQTYASLGKYVRHIHVKDGKMGDVGQPYCLMGEGNLPLNDLLELLRENRYDGCLSLEWEKRWVPELAEPETALPQFIEYMKSRL